MEIEMKKTLLIGAASLALLAVPALVAVPAHAKSKAMAQASEQNAPPLFAGEGVIQGNNVYDCEGKYLGSDPDPNVRLQMLRTGSPAACK